MADQRETITIKLTPGKDDDLIQWWQSLPKGDHKTDGRQGVVKSTLRAGLQYPIPEPQREKIEAIQHELDQRREWDAYRDEQITVLLQRLNEVENTPNAPNNGISTHQIEAMQREMYQEWETLTRQLVDSLPATVQQIVEEALNTPPTHRTPPPVQAVNQIDQQTAAEREARLKKASW